MIRVLSALGRAAPHQPSERLGETCDTAGHARCVAVEHARSDTWGVSSVSCRVNGRMRMVANRPAPEWRRASGEGRADPVRMNWPGAPESSTARRTWSHSTGASCYSSSSRGDHRRAAGGGRFRCCNAMANCWSATRDRYSTPPCRVTARPYRLPTGLTYRLPLSSPAGGVLASSRLQGLGDRWATSEEAVHGSAVT
jgi:hypothetical protein